jgi:hypothetical protein
MSFKIEFVTNQCVFLGFKISGNLLLILDAFIIKKEILRVSIIPRISDFIH